MKTKGFDAIFEEKEIPLETQWVASGTAAINPNPAAVPEQDGGIADAHAWTIGELAAAHNRDMAEARKRVAELEAENARLRADKAEMAEHMDAMRDCQLRTDKALLRPLMILLYNQGYRAGHHDTVEARYTDIHRSDMDTYHENVVDDIIDDWSEEDA